MFKSNLLFAFITRDLSFSQKKKSIIETVSSCNICFINHELSLFRTTIGFRDTYRPCREHSGSVVECLTRDRMATGSSLTDVTALWSLSKTHLS